MEDIRNDITPASIRLALICGDTLTQPSSAIAAVGCRRIQGSYPLHRLSVICPELHPDTACPTADEVVTDLEEYKGISEDCDGQFERLDEFAEHCCLEVSPK